MQRRRGGENRRWTALVLATALTVSSFAPASMQIVQAAETVSESPFGKNVALEAEAEIIYPAIEEWGVEEEVEDDETLLNKLNDGNYEESGETDKLTVNDELKDRPADIVFSLKEKTYIDNVVVCWNASAPAQEYEVLVSEDKNEWMSVATVTKAPVGDESGKATMSHSFEPQYAQYVKIACKTPSAYNTYAFREVEIYTVGSVEEALDFTYSTNKAVVASYENHDGASAINDDNENTRWGSEPNAEEHWIYMDLQEVKTINQVKLLWEGAYATSYSIEVATDAEITDATEWTAVVKDYSELTGAGWITHDFANAEARYVRLIGVPYDAGWGISIFEMQVNYIRTQIPLEQLYLSQYEALITEIGGTFELFAQPYPANAAGADSIEWSSSDESVVTVENGVVTAVGNGTADIIVTCRTVSEEVSGDVNEEEVSGDASGDANEEEVSGDASGDVNEEEVSGDASGDAEDEVSGDASGDYVGGIVGYALESVSDENSNVIIAKCKVTVAEQLETPDVTAKKTDNNQIQLSWEAIVNADGYVIERTAGDVINTFDLESTTTGDTTVSWTDETVVAGITYTYKVKAVDTNEVYATSEWSNATEAITLPLAVDSIALDLNKAELVVGGETLKLNVTIEPENATDKSVTWSSDAPEVAIVSETGEVTAIAKGTATITVKTENGKEDTCAVTVKERLATPVVSTDDSKATSNKIIITWESVENAANYEIYRAGKDGEYSLLITVTDALTYTDEIDTELPADKYSYYVIAKPAEDSTEYATSNASESTKAIQIGQASPFGLNIAEGKSVTVTYLDTETEDARIDELKKLLDGYYDVFYETEAVESMPGIREDRAADIVIDLEEETYIDNVAIAWAQAAPAKEYEIFISNDKETWTSIGTVNETPTVFENETATIEHSFEPQDVRYIKVSCQAPSAYGVYTIREIAAYTPGTVEVSGDAVNTVTELLISDTEVRVENGASYQLFAQPLPANTTQAVTWESDAEDIVMVTGGKITAVGLGVATVTATAGDQTAECKVIVTQTLDAPIIMAELDTTDESKKKVSVSWSKVEGAASYHLYRAEVSGDYVEIGEYDSQGNVVAEREETAPEASGEAQAAAEDSVADTDELITVWDTFTTENEGKTYTYKVTADNRNVEYYEVSDYSNETEEVFIPIRVTKVALEDITIPLNKAVKLDITIEPENATDQTITWESLTTDVATIDENGKVTGLKNGSATIKATVDGVSTTCTVTVAAQLTVPENVKATLTEDNTISLSWDAVADANAYDIYRATASGDAEKIATSMTNAYTDETVEVGYEYSYSIKAADTTGKHASSDMSDSTDVIDVPVLVTEVTLNVTEATVIVPNVLQLIATVLPETATDNSVTWTSDNPEVAFVEDGWVNPVAPGTAKIIAKAGGVEAVCTITVQARIGQPTEVVAKKTASHEITLTWTAVEGAAGYDVYRAVGKHAAFELYKENVTETTLVDAISAEDPGTVYTYKVVAKPETAIGYIQSEASIATEGIQIGEVSPFGMNVAEDKEVTVTYLDTEVEDTRTDELKKLLDGAYDAFYETEAVESEPGVRVDRQADIVIDLADETFIDNVVISWAQNAPAKEYEVFISNDKETWTSIGTVDETPTVFENETATFEHSFEPQDVRYIKVACKTPSAYGVYTIKEIAVYTPGTVEVSGDAVNTVTDLLISETDITMQKDDLYQIFAQALPANTTFTMEWECDNPEVVTVVGGKLTAVGIGSATVTVTVGDKTQTCKVTVEEQLKTPTIAATFERETKKATVMWNVVENANSYILYRAVNAGEYIEITDVPFEETETGIVYVDTFTDEDEGNTYTYKVKAVNTENEYYLDSDESNITESFIVPVEVDSVAIEDKEIFVGDKEVELKVTLTPDNATIDKTEWKSSDETVVTIADGKVTGLKVGTATITYVVNGKEYTCTVTVKDYLAQPQNVKAVKAEDNKSITVSWDAVANADSYTVLKSVDKANYVALAEVKDEVTYVDADIKEGSTYSYQVKANSDNVLYVSGEASEATEDVSIPVKVTGVTLDQTEITIEVNGEATLVETVAPENATNKAVTWKSSDETIATVTQNGKVTGVASGDATITVTTDDGGKTATCTVIVTEKAAVEPIQLSAPVVSAELAEDKASIMVSWNVVDNADGYTVLKAEDNEAYTEVEDAELATVAGVVSYVDAAVEEGKTYSYKVVAISTDEAYTASEESEATEGILVPKNEMEATQLAAPVVSAVLAGNEEFITVLWNTVAHADGYTLLKAVDDGVFTEVKDADLTIAEDMVSYVDKAIEAGKTYSYKVVATSTDSAYLSSAESSATKGILIPEKVPSSITVTGVALDKTELELTVNQEAILTATVLPEAASNKGVQWISSNPNVAAVTDGKVKALAEGEATITVVTDEGFKTATCKVTVKTVSAPVQNPPTVTEVKATSIKITGISKKIAAGKKLQLTATVAPSDVTNGAVIWSSDNEKFATVDAKGKVTTKKAGKNKTVTITATAADGSGVKQTYKIKIMSKAVKKIKIKAATTSVNAGKKLKLKAVITPSNKKQTNLEVKWSSSNTRYATVTKKGVVVTKKAGKGKKVKITAKATDGSNKKKTITIKIK